MTIWIKIAIEQIKFKSYYLFFYNDKYGPSIQVDPDSNECL